MNRQLSSKLCCFLFRTWAISGTSLVSLGLTTVAIAQPITPATDGTGTVINQQGNEYLITGGTQSGSNLFQSFEKFGLNSGQIANFVGNPTLANILGRVTGGDVSIIDGLLKVSNSNANLYLMNPAGFIFGANAQLDLSGSFAATTATGIGFDGGLFNVTGNNYYSALVGNPNGFYFGAIATDTSTGLPGGSIINLGNLTVQQGQNLSLIGRAVVSTGDLSASGGKLAVVAVPGQDAQVLRYSQPNMILGLELLKVDGNVTPQTLANIKTTDLPVYLTGGTDPLITADGNVSIGGSQLPLTQGTVILSGQVNAANPTGVGGDIVVTGDKVALLDAQVNASGLTGGGNVRIGGDYQGSGTLPKATVTIVDQNTAIAADALTTGNGGKIIAWADDTTKFYGTATAKGGTQSGNGGLIETSGKRFVDLEGATINTSATQGNTGTWLLDPSNLTIDNTGNSNITGSPNFNTTATPATLSAITLQNALALNNVTVTTAGGTGGNGDITFNTSINSTSGNSLTLTSRGFIRSSGLINLAGAGGNLTFNINSVNPGTAAPLLLGQSIQAAHDAIGTVTGTSTINLGAGTFQKGSSLSLSKAVTINGSGVGSTIIDGGGSDRVIEVTTAGNAQIQNVTIQNGNSSLSGGGGGGILNSGRLILNNSEVINNSAPLPLFDGGGLSNIGTATITGTTFRGNTSGGKGGAIANDGNLSLISSNITGNRSTGVGGGLSNNAIGIVKIANSTFSGNNSASQGGAIANQGSLSLTNTMVTGNTAVNQGGGIISFNGTTDLSNSIVSGNNSSSNGGGIYNSGRGTFTLTNSTVSGNNATGNGGGILNSGAAAAANLTNSTVSSNNAYYGGGIFNNAGITILQNSTISENSSVSAGGGIFNQYGTTTLTNSTVSGNSSNRYGGGIWNYGTLDVKNSTIANNSAAVYGGGLVNGFNASMPGLGGTAMIANSIIAGSSGRDVSDSGGGITFNGNNIVKDSSVTGAGILNVDPKLSPLGNYGGLTQTHFLLMGSPAIDRGVDSFAAGLYQDQRGGDRLIDTVDLGAVEFQGTTLNILSGDGQSTLVNTSFKPIVIAATENFFGNPLAGLTIDLTAPSSGASTNPITFSGVTNEFGQVSITPTANGLAGTFSVMATAFKSGASEGGEGTASATLTNESELDITSCPPDCDQTIDETPDNSVEETTDIEVEDIQESLKQILTQTKIKPALIYARFRPVTDPVATTQNVSNKDLKKDPTPKVDDGQGGQIEWEFKGDRLTDFLNSATEDFLHPRKTLGANDELELVMITSSGKVFRHSIPGATRVRVMSKVRDFVRGVTNPSFGQSYLAPAQYLYDILVRPLEQELQVEKIGNLTYIMDDGLRALPLAALHDGKQFIIEKYSVGLMPSFSLTNTSNYVEPKNNSLLTMGASKFTDEANLPAAPLEAQTIQKIWQEQGGTAGDALVDDKFTVANFLAARKKTSYGILHLATHGEFNTGDDSDSYIRFEDQRVYLNELDKLQLGNPPLELLVLSACKTAIGDRNAELGFAGLALASGAKSVIGSIWYVSDAGTMGLMTRFYQELQNAPIKAEALRQAQLALLHGEVHQEGTQLLSSRGGAPIQLPPALANTTGLDLSHPFFWSGFALVGNPW